MFFYLWHGGKCERLCPESATGITHLIVGEYVDAYAVAQSRDAIIKTRFYK